MGSTGVGIGPAETEDSLMAVVSAATIDNI